MSLSKHEARYHVRVVKASARLAGRLFVQNARKIGRKGIEEKTLAAVIQRK